MVGYGCGLMKFKAYKTDILEKEIDDMEILKITSELSKIINVVTLDAEKVKGGTNYNCLFTDNNSVHSKIEYMELARPIVECMDRLISGEIYGWDCYKMEGSLFVLDVAFS